MPTYTLEVTGDGNRNPVIGGQQVDGGTLLSLCAIVQVGSTRIGRTHVLAGLYKGQPLVQNMHTVIIDDYVYNAHSPQWDGRIAFEAGEGLMAIVRSSDAPIIRITGKGTRPR